MSQSSATSAPKTPSRFYSLWKFSRPHTVIGTSLSVLGLYGVSLAVHPGIAQLAAFALLPAHLLSLALAWVACLCGNIYIVGLNQLTDIAIDRINKPHLPLASEEFSRTEGIKIVTVTGILALLLAGWQGVFLLITVGSSLMIGTAYSLPPIRLKRFPFWAALCIFVVRGMVVNLGVFLHFSHTFNPQPLGMAQVLGVIPAIPIQVWLLTAFVVAFTFAIAIFKDIPDIDGDRQYQITTFTIKLGAERVLTLGLGVLTGCYLGMAIAAWLWFPVLPAIALILSQLLILGVLWWQSQKVDLQDKGAIAQFYQFIWKLFFLEYLIFPAACLLKFLPLSQ